MTFTPCILNINKISVKHKKKLITYNYYLKIIIIIKYQLFIHICNSLLL